MGKKKILDCLAMVMYLALCMAFRVILAKEITEEQGSKMVTWLDRFAGKAKKRMDWFDVE